MAKRIRESMITDRRVLSNYVEIKELLIDRIEKSSLNSISTKKIIRGLRNIEFIHRESNSRTIGSMTYEGSVLKLTNKGMALVDNSQKDIIAHEILHLVAYIHFKGCQGHNRNFKNICSLLGFPHMGMATYKAEGNYISEFEPPKKVVKPYKYETVCTCCGKVTGRYKVKAKAVKHPSLFTSKCCGAVITSKEI